MAPRQFVSRQFVPRLSGGRYLVSCSMWYYIGLGDAEVTQRCAGGECAVNDERSALHGMTGERCAR